MNMQKLSALLGLAQRAGKVVSGEFAVDTAIKTGKLNLLIIACDTAEKTKKNLYAVVLRKNITVHEIMTKDQLGMSIGRAHRASLGIIDLGFSKALIKELAKINNM